MSQKIVECASLGIPLPEKVAQEVDAIYKGLPQECRNLSIQRKAYTAEDIHFEVGERSEVSILTTETVDKTNEVVLVAGLEMEPYRKSGVVLWNHNQDMPVGKNVWIIRYGNSVRAKTNYPADPEAPVEKSEDGEDESWFPDYVWKMTKAGALKGKSIGFLPLVPKRDATAEELELHPEWQGAGIWESSLLLEYSCCTVGINNDALVEAVNTKSLDLAKMARLGIELKAEEKKEPYGEVEYADPGYQKDKEKRYPIDTEEHIRAAWNYINKEKDSGKYSAEHLKEIKDRIIAAWKKKIDPKGPPEEQKEDKSALILDTIIKASDPCVSQKIKHMYDKGEDSKYSRAQIIAIAYSFCDKGKKSYAPKKRVVKADINKMIADALEKVSVDRILKMSEKMWKNRGKL